jgi:hypothetical protein
VVVQFCGIEYCIGVFVVGGFEEFDLRKLAVGVDGLEGGEARGVRGVG